MLFWRGLLVGTFTIVWLLPKISIKPAQAKLLNQYCHISSTAIKAKQKLRRAAVTGDTEVQNSYRRLVQQHAQAVRDCRNRTWPQVQAIWLRLYPCDAQRGAIDEIMDKIIDKGYNQVYLEVFYDGRVLLPAASNPTVWPSVIRTTGAENVDLLSTAIQKGRERGLKVYAWMFTTNFGYSYAQRRDREGAIARNGKGETSLYVVDNSSQVFIDPYNQKAKQDYYRLVQAVTRRRPDGILFDYIRYPRQAGTNSIATKVTDLWLYSEAIQKALFERAQNNKGLELIRRFLRKGYVTAADVAQMDRLYPREGEPRWQGRVVNQGQKSLQSPQDRQPQLQWDLWQLSVAHAMQGILDFVALAAYPAQQRGIPAGVVFFPGGNQTLGRGYDSRLQPWDRFPSNLEWHPMAYANCGKVNCIVPQVQRVVSMAKPGTKIIPALAGNWGTSMSNRPPLEAQMGALRKFAPKLRGVSHFAYSWQHPEHDGDRKYCRVR